MSTETEEFAPAREKPWEELAEHLSKEDLAAAAELIAELSPEERRLAISRLAAEDQFKLFEGIDSKIAADIIEGGPDVQAVEVFGGVSPEVAADIAEEMSDVECAEIIRELEDSQAEAVLRELDDQEEAGRIRDISSYPSNTAGGLMTEHVASVTSQSTVGDVLRELNNNASFYSDMDVQYVYVTNAAKKLLGVLRLRDLVLTPPEMVVEKIMIPEPVSVLISEPLEDLVSLFDEKAYVGLPVVTEEGILTGVISGKTVYDAASDHIVEEYRNAAGIVGGEELRSMPLLLRSRRRLAWLAPNIILNLVAASVIAMYEDTLQAVIALAVFLPIVSDMSGCSGNQAVAVSIRELSLGLIRPTEFVRVVWKEGLLGLINGIILGILLGSIAAIWKTNLWLGLVIGGSLALNTILSVLLGGCVPLLLKRFKVDPALASGPILTTCTDMCGFFLVLNIASLVITKLG